MLQGDYKWYEQSHKFIGKEVIAAEKLNAYSRIQCRHKKEFKLLLLEYSTDVRLQLIYRDKELWLTPQLLQDKPSVVFERDRE